MMRPWSRVVLRASLEGPSHPARSTNTLIFPSFGRLQSNGDGGGLMRPEGGSGRTVQCAIDVRYAFGSEQISPLVPAKPSTRRTRDKGVNALMIRVLPVGLSSESQTSGLKQSVPKPNGGETEAGGLRVVQSFIFRTRLWNLHVGEPRSTAERPRDER